VLSATAAGVVGLVVLLLIAPRRRSSTEAEC
jgi:MYXO-CTERM domain-containing protein